LKSSRTSEDGPSAKTVPHDDNDKISLLIGLNIRITEVYVKQKGGIKTESLGIKDDLYSRRLKNKKFAF